MIESKMKKCENENNSHLVTARLIIRKEESEDLVRAFTRCKSPSAKGQKPPLPAQVAQEALSRFYKFTPVTWKMVYHDRLGIDFGASQQWFEELIENVANKSNLENHLSKKINDCFLTYIHFVHMIITVFPKPTGEVIDRIKVFQTAVTCFGRYTEEIMREDLYILSGIKKIFAIWKYISFWIANDDEYRLREVVWGQDSKITLAWKSIFNFIFGFSVDTFHHRICFSI
jgi:hypothetical protein